MSLNLVRPGDCTEWGPVLREILQIKTTEVGPCAGEDPCSAGFLGFLVDLPLRITCVLTGDGCLKALF